MSREHRYCVVMCGGAGVRFWPLSRAGAPKQFLDLLGIGRTLLQMTVDRLDDVVSEDHILFVTNEGCVDLIREQLPHIPARNILAEPVRRNTAAPICWAAHHIRAIDPQGVFVTIPSDHIVMQPEAFRDALNEGFEFVENCDSILTLGVNPTFPCERYGYLQTGEPVEGWPGIMTVKSFTEKPAADMARLFVASGEFYWNAGIIIWSADNALRAFARYAPDIEDLFGNYDSAYGTPDEAEAVDKAFRSSPSITIDYAITERASAAKASGFYVKAVNIGWSDLGSWQALYENTPHSAEGNVTEHCQVLSTDCRGTIFRADPGKLIVASGLDDYIVADTPDALLICPRHLEQKIKGLVIDVKNRFGEKYL